jgi:hypothetical protein
MPVLPDQFDSTPAETLLACAGKGLIGFDVRLIDSLLARPAETLDALDRFIAAGHDEDLLDLTEQIFDLYRALRSPRALPFYLGLIERGEPGGIPDELIEAIAVHGAAAVEPLLALKQRLDLNEEQGADIVFVLAALGVRDERIASLLRQTLARDPYEGALSIGLAGDPALKPDVEAALAALPESAAEERKVLAECMEALNRETPPGQHEHVDIRAQYPDEALPLFDQIKPEAALEFLSCQDPAYRAHAAGCFLDEDYADHVRDRLLSVAANDPAPEVRGAACRSLGERIEEPEVRAFLLARLRQSDNPVEKRGVLVGLAGATALSGVHKDLLEAWNSPLLRAAAVETMWRSLDPRYTRYFAEALECPDPDVRRHAIQGVGAFPISELAARLVPLFDDEDLREDALFAYALSLPGPTTRKGVQKMFSDIEARAQGLTGAEEESVALALDRRLEREGLPPFYFPPEPPPAPVTSSKTGRNDPCPCGSGKKFKKCCGA